MGKDQVGHADLVGKGQTDLHSHSISFLNHVDTPLDYTGAAGKFVKVNAVPDGLIFASLSAGDLPAHNHARENISDFWGEPFWANIPDKPSTYSPSSHSHPRSQITNFWSAPFWGSIPDKPSTFTPSAHTSTHHSGGSDQVNHDSLMGFVAAEHKPLPNTIAQVLSNHTKAIHTSLGLFPYTGGTFTGVVYAADHAVSGHTDQIVNVCYGTGGPPTAMTTTIGTLFVKYTV